MKTPWLRYTLDEIVARLKEDLPTYHDEAPADVTMALEEALAAADVTMAPAEAPAAADVTMAPAEAPADVVMAPAEAPEAADEISDAQAFLRAASQPPSLLRLRRAVGGLRHS